MKTALLTGLAAFALGATCATALTGTGSAAPVAASATSADDTCTGAAASSPSCVVERVLTLDPSPTASPSASATAAAAGAADDDGTPDQGRGDRPAVAPTAPAAPAAPAVKLRGDGSVDDSQPSSTSTAAAPARPRTGRQAARRRLGRRQPAGSHPGQHQRRGRRRDAGPGPRPPSRPHR